MPTRRLYRPIAALGAFTLVAVFVVPQAAAARAPGAPSASKAVVTKQSVRVLTRQRSLSSLGAGAGHLSPGGKGPESPPSSGEPDANGAVVNRSLSPRPNSHNRANAAAGALSVPVVASTPVRGATPNLGVSFEGLNLFQERYVANNGNQFTLVPPDQGMCVGNGFVLESLNDVLRVFTTAGQAKSKPIDLNSFYGYPAIIDRTTGKFGPNRPTPVVSTTA